VNLKTAKINRKQRLGETYAVITHIWQYVSAITLYLGCSSIVAAAPPREDFIYKSCPKRSYQYGFVEEGGMKQLEKINISLSILALGFSVLIPVLGYFWLDPNLQAFKNRARLQVSNRLPTRNNESNDFLQDKPYKIDIANVGRLPAKDVLMTLQYSHKEEVDTEIQLLPPVPVDVVIKEDTKFVTLKKSLAPQDVIQVKFAFPPKTVWVANEFGETTIVNIDVDPFYKSYMDVQRELNGLKKDLIEWKKEREQKNTK